VCLSLADRNHWIVVDRLLHHFGFVLFKTGKRSRRGSALLLVLFAIILLTGLVTATVGIVSNDVDEYGALNKAFRARQLAESGLAFGLDPQVQNQDRGLLEQVAPDGGRFHVFISSESTKLNINFVLQNGRGDLLSDLFIRWGVSPKAADTAADALLEYLKNSTTTPAAVVLNAQPAATVQPAATAQAAASPQATAATNQTVALVTQFGSVAEMANVPAFDPIMAKRPDWMNFFTVWGDGRIDVNLADADTISLVTGVPKATADQMVKYRWGPDGKPFTLDDRVYNSMDEVRAALGMSPEQFQLVQNLLSLTSAVDRIESTGIIAGYEKQIVVVTSRNTIPITYLSWQEK
jgi:general secretion pathway protein K